MKFTVSCGGTFGRCLTSAFDTGKDFEVEEVGPCLRRTLVLCGAPKRDIGALESGLAAVLWLADRECDSLLTLLCILILVVVC